MSLSKHVHGEAKEFITGRSVHAIHSEFIATRRHLDQACENWILLATEREIQMTVRYVAHKIDELFEGKKVVLVGILNGAFVCMRDISKYLTIPHKCAFVQASSYSTSQSQSAQVNVQMTIHKDQFKGHVVVLVDELFDHGTTLLAVASKLADKLGRKREDIVTCCIFTKMKPKPHKTTYPDICGLIQLPDVWLVGYGLDYKGEKRGWPHLYACPKMQGICKSPDDAIFTNCGATIYKKARTMISTQYNLFLRNIGS